MNDHNIPKAAMLHENKPSLNTSVSSSVSTSTGLNKRPLCRLSNDDIDLIVERFEVNGRVDCVAFTLYLSDLVRSRTPAGNSSPFRLSSEWSALKAGSRFEGAAYRKRTHRPTFHDRLTNQSLSIDLPRDGESANHY